MFRFLLEKRAISPVVATSLLLVVAVSAVVFFQGWFNDFSSSVLVDIESDSSSSNSAVRVEGVVNDNLYLKTLNDASLDLLIVKDDLGNEVCSFENVGDNLTISGLLGHWKFDDYNSTIKDYSGNNHNGDLFGITKVLLNFDNTNANDLTNYNNDGVINGATWTSSDCVSGGCYQFDGVDDYINLSNFNSDINNSNSEFSISFWFKSVGNISHTVIAGANYDDGRIYLGVHNDSRKIALGFGEHTWVAYADIFKDITISNDVFYHVVITKEWDELTLFINGDKIETKYSDNFIGLGKDFKIGAMHYENNPSQNYNFNGTVDEFAIYSKELSDLEIKNLYNSQKANFVEFSNNGLEFDGVSNFVRVLNHTDFDIDGNKEYSFYIDFKPRFSGDSHYILASMYNGGIVGLFAGAINSTDLIHLREVAPFSHNSLFDFGKIKNYKIVLSYNGTDSLNYINGQLVSNLTIGSVPDKPLLDLYFGADLLNNNPRFFYDGFINEIKFYNKSLNSSEVKIISNPNLDLKGQNLNNIDLSSCNLEKGKKYDVLTGSKDGLSEVSVIVK